MNNRSIPEHSPVGRFGKERLVRHAQSIAFCGIDGAGKTSLASELLKLPQLKNGLYLKKHYRENANRLIRAHPGEASNCRCYLSGRFALAHRWAYALDFLHCYQNEIAPLFAREGVLLLDRWSPCILAWADMVAKKCCDNIALVASALPSPEVLIYVELDPFEARRRIEARGDPRPDEDIAILCALEQSYNRVFKRYNIPVHRVDNRSFSQALDHCEDIVRRIMK